MARYARGDIGPQFATTYRLPIPKDAPFTIGYTFEGNPHTYLPDIVGTLTSGKLFIAEAGMEDNKRGNRNLAKAEAARRLASLGQGVFWIGTEKTLTKFRHYNLVFLHARRESFLAFADIAEAAQGVWPWGEVASVEEVAQRLAQRWPTALVEAAVWKVVADSAATGHLLVDKELTDQGRLQYNHPFGLCLVAAARGSVIPFKETLDQPETTWLQWRRRLDKVQPFCRVTSHTSEEVREILASLETVYRELIPQLNLRRWSGSIYTWLTQPVLDPANSGRVTMDYLMKLVTTALEWTYQARESDVRAETLELAASLLVLRKDTLRIIDGAGPGVEADQASDTKPEQASETQAEQVSSSNEEQKIPPISPTEQATQAQSRRPESHPKSGVQLEPNQSAKCTFFGVVPIDIKRFEESGVSLVECPDCGRTWTLSPRGGVLRFKSHDKRKTNTPNTGRRWAMGKTTWEVVGGERT
ncbi:hypothetical protein KSZ_55410 [Dictyobacter formicarum]|uniref:Uncharacterized protein n=1 Tax=Dictyobacter formicarum TaxID=2778368 RepID=A0ABQ3VN67_9CHLR|nr:hypothetical protein KSZ_55410 [Dictyobacter formicarum]